MKKEDITRFKLAINKARLSLPGPNLTDKEKALRIEVFWEILSPHAIEKVERAFKRAILELKFFPTPSHILDFIHEEAIQTIPEREQLEWMEPTDEGKRRALEIIAEMKERWAKEDLEKEEKRVENMEGQRVVLKKQAKIFLINKGEKKDANTNHS
jgi:hypothetical protein